MTRVMKQARPVQAPVHLIIISSGIGFGMEENSFPGEDHPPVDIVESFASQKWLGRKFRKLSEERVLM